MKKTNVRLISAFLCLAFLFGSVQGYAADGSAKKPEKPSVSAKSACIYCVDTEEVIYSKKKDAHRKMASTTKVMTAVLLIESGKLKENTKVSKKAAETSYGNLYIRAGDVYKNKDLLYALLVSSSNEAAAVIAEGVSGSQSKFVKKMNKKAKKLGLNDTHYKNPHGLNAKDHYTSAYDLCRLTAYAYNLKDFRKPVTTEKYSFTSVKLKKKKTVETTDRLNGYSKNHKGGKTGFTTPSGYCYTSVYVYKGKTYTVSLLGSESDSARTKEVKALYKYIRQYVNE